MSQFCKSLVLLSHLRIELLIFHEGSLHSTDSANASGDTLKYYINICVFIIHAYITHSVQIVSLVMVIGTEARQLPLNRLSWIYG